MSGTDEQQVRTEAGWIGVEISKSRVRTPGKAGYGLWRVRGSVAQPCGCEQDRGQHVWKLGDWTPYAFTLGQILDAVQAAVREGQPNGPGTVRLRKAVSAEAPWMAGDERYVVHSVPTRWTSRYRGRRDLGERVPQMADQLTAVTVSCLDELEPDGRVCPGVLAFLDGDAQVRCSDCRGWVGRLSPTVLRQTGEGDRPLVVGEGLPAQFAPEASRPVSWTTAPGSTVRSRQREFNAAFQRAHAIRRKHGKARYHEMKLSLGKRSADPGVSDPPSGP